MSNENKVTLSVSITNIDKLKDLSLKLSSQCEQVIKTVDEINKLELEIKI